MCVCVFIMNKRENKVVRRLLLLLRFAGVIRERDPRGLCDAGVPVIEEEEERAASKVTSRATAESQVIVRSKI